MHKKIGTNTIIVCVLLYLFAGIAHASCAIAETELSLNAFDEGKQAVKELMQIVDSKGTVSDAAHLAIDCLVKTYRSPVQIAIEKIEIVELFGCNEDYYINNTYPWNKCDKLLIDFNKVKRELTMANDKLSKGHPDEAIENYKYALGRALKTLSYAPGSDSMRASK